MNSTESEWNLLTCLHRWAWRQDENFVSEAFAHLLRRLLIREPAQALEFLREFVRPYGKGPCFQTAANAVVRTQVTVDGRRPDIEIDLGEHLIYVEVKLDAVADEDKLQGYADALKRRRHQNRETTLVLLTRYPATHISEPKDLVRRRWFWIADMLSKVIEKCADPVSRHQINQFTGFLRSRGVTMDRVGWEYEAGIEAFLNLQQMICEAVAAWGQQASVGAAQGWIAVKIGDGDCYVGLRYDEPCTLVFCTQPDRFEVSQDAADQVGYGQSGDGFPLPWPGQRWWLTLDLGSEKEHFFARTRGSQRKCLEEFIKKGLEAVSKLRGESGPA